MIAAVVLIGEGGGQTRPLTWIHEARRRAARDLIDLLIEQPLIERLIVATPDGEGVMSGSDKLEYYQTEPGPIHVGQTLERIGRLFQLTKFLYFGGGSAPLLSTQILAEVIERLVEEDEIVLTNNLHASDWAAIAPYAAVAHWKERLPQDNMIGWVLSQEACLPAHETPATSATRLDIDTPADLLTLKLHPRTRPYLKEYLASIPMDTSPMEKVIKVLATPASQVFLAGRIGPDAWSAVNKVSRCWIRVISEERGMISSGRRASGQAYSLLAEHIDLVGARTFFTTLSQKCHAALIDSRLLLAHHRRWPAASDRYASDLGLTEQVADPWLKAFTMAANEAPMPIVLGGHGLVSGDLLAICDML